MLSTLPLYVRPPYASTSTFARWQLRLLEIRGDPDLVHLHDGEQRLSRLRDLPGVDAFLRDDAAHRCLDCRVLEIQLRLREIRAGLLHVRLGRGRACFDRGDLLRRGFRRLQLGPRLLLTGARLGELALGDANARL